jgi:undecaprenyl-diphosphatase
MNYLLAIFAGALQGVTEFLPISSSAHLLLLHEIFKFDLGDNLTFDVALHFGTLIALLLVFWRDILKMIKDFFAGLKERSWNTVERRLPWLIIIGSIPAGIFGYFLNDIIDYYLHSGKLAIMVTAVMLFVVAILFLVVEKYAVKLNSIKDLRWPGAVVAGMAQAIALIPGTSRSGITIIAGMVWGLKRDEAARFSFLLSIPIVGAAALKKLLDLPSVDAIDWLLLSCGVLSAVLTGYFSAKFLLRYLGSRSLAGFAYYRIVLALVLFAWLLLQ